MNIIKNTLYILNNTKNKAERLFILQNLRQKYNQLNAEEKQAFDSLLKQEVSSVSTIN